MATPPPLPPRPGKPLPAIPGQPKTPAAASAVAAAKAGPPVGRDLKEIGEKVAANPSLAKRFLRSGAFSSYRRLAGKGTVSGLLKMGQSAISAGLGNIPIPGVGGVIERAFDNTCNLIRRKIHKDKANNLTYAVAPEDKIKFELKELGATVADWDGYRWKVQHAVDEYKKATTDILKADYGGRPPCDAWVRVFAKYYYIHSRVKKFQASVTSVLELAKELDKWLDAVDKAATAEEAKLDAAYQTAHATLANLPSDDHEPCSEYKCMFKTKSWTCATYVPTSNEALFLVRGAKYVWSWGVGDPITTAVGTGAAQGVDAMNISNSVF